MKKAISHGLLIAAGFVQGIIFSNFESLSKGDGWRWPLFWAWFGFWLLYYIGSAIDWEPRDAKA